MTARRSTAGTLDVDGTLETSTVALADDTTLNIDGSVQAVGATQTAITGTTGVNNVVVNAGSTLLATGDLGDGNDVLDVAGSFDIGGGTFFLGAGDDTFVVHDNTAIAGTVDGGDGLDTRVYNINSKRRPRRTVATSRASRKTGSACSAFKGAGSSDLAEVDVLGGTLNVASTGGIVGVTERDRRCRRHAERRWRVRFHRGRRHVQRGGHDHGCDFDQHARWRRSAARSPTAQT